MENISILIITDNCGENLEIINKLSCCYEITCREVTDNIFDYVSKNELFAIIIVGKSSKFSKILSELSNVSFPKLIISVSNIDNDLIASYTDIYNNLLLYFLKLFNFFEIQSIIENVKKFYKLQLINIDVCNTLKDKQIEIESLKDNFLIETQKDKELINKLQHSEEKFKNIFNTTKDPIVIHSFLNRILEVNDAFYAQFKYTESDLKSGEPVVFIPQKYHEQLRQRMQQIDYKELSPIEIEILDKTGNIVFVEINSKLIIYENEKAVISILRNITERKMMEKIIKISEERYKHITNSITDYIYKLFIESDGSIKIIQGPACEIITGYTQKEFENNPKLWSEIIHESDKSDVELFYEKSLKSKKQGSFEFRIYHKNGKLKWLKNTLVFYKDYGTELIEYNGIIKDITNEKLLENKVLSSILETEEKERARIAQELHDGIGPVLSSLKIYIQLIKENPYSKINDLINQASASIESAVTGIKEISNNLSPHILQKFGFLPALHSFSDKIKESIKIDINIQSNFKSRLPLNVEIVLYRVVVENIHNTIKHANASSIIILFNKKNNKIILLYKDNGKGFNVNQTIKKKSGMGLFNIQNRIESIGGKLTIKSKLNVGTLIKIVLFYDLLF